MKVCPHCNGITEETKAIKCAVCGMDITNEPEYTQEELEDDFISDELNQQHNKKIKQKLSALVSFSYLFAMVTRRRIELLLPP